jgi:hypothetical protein
MDSECFRIEEMEVLSRLGSDDARLDHLRSCPKCRALLASYRAFSEPRAVPQGTNLGDARARLQVFLSREIAGVDGAILGTRPPEGTADGGLLSFFAGLIRRPLRPALALLAIAVLLAGVSRVVDFGLSGDQEIVLRGGTDPNGQPALVLETPVPLEDGRVRLSWSAIANAEGYRVIFFSVGLTECGRVDVGRVAEVEIDPADVPCLTAGSGPVFYRVVALRQNEPSTASPPRAFPLDGARATD